MSSDITINSTREDFLAFLRAKLNTFIEPPTPSYGPSREKKRISSDLHIEVESQQLSQVSEALAEAEKLNRGQAHVNRDNFDQENEKISEEISKALPTLLISTLIQSYCEDRSRTFIQIGREQRKRTQRTATLALVVLIAGLIFFVAESLLSLISHQMFFLVSGIVCASAGLVLLGISALQGRDLNKTIQKQDLFNKLKISQVLIEQVTDEDLKNETLQNLFVAMLTRNTKFPSKY